MRSWQARLGEKTAHASILREEWVLLIEVAVTRLGGPPKEMVDGQMYLAQRLSSRGEWTIVADSAHMIPEESPDAIVNAVRKVYTVVGGT